MVIHERGIERRGAESPPTPRKSLDQTVEYWEALGISSLDAWDVLVFLCRHRTSLATADEIARLLGYSGNVIEAALDQLESLRLLRRSRAVRGVQLLQFVFDGEGVRHLADHRSGRLLLAQKLKRKEDAG